LQESAPHLRYVHAFTFVRNMRTEDAMTLTDINLDVAPEKEGETEERPSRDEVFRSPVCLVAVMVVLATATIASYWPVRDNGFINFDDNKYITENPHVTDGLTPSNVVWAFTTGYAANWHPLTWLSHQLDASLYGHGPGDAGGHHMTSVLLHAANASLLLLVLRRMTGMLWRSAVVASLFALHPIHVESVAWVSERKDVLSAFFCLLALWAYAGYAIRPAWGRYWSVTGLFALGLLSKPMLVSLPILLLFLDYWPLRRFDSASRRTAMLLFLEKVPLAALSLLSCLVTLFVQRQGEAMRSLDTHPLAIRIENAAVSYVMYIKTLFFPKGLAIFYPYTFSIPLWQFLLSLFALIAATGLVAILRKRAPYLLTGWLWYLTALVPVIGLVQVGHQSHADRYAYIPSIGVTMALVWAGADALSRMPKARSLAVAAVAAALIACAYRTHVETRYWKTSVTLFGRAAEVTENNSLAYYNMGTEQLANGELDKAIRSYREAVRIRPDYVNAHLNMGIAHMRQEENETAAECFRRIIELRPSHADAHINLATVLYRMDRYEEAAEAYREVIRLEPENVSARYSLGLCLARLGRPSDAADAYREALRIDPDHSNARSALKKLSQEEESGAAPGKAFETEYDAERL